jgi:hypothetical protein
MLGLLPWEDWLPPYVFGPLLCIGSILFLLFGGDLSWWQIIVFSFGAAFGGWGTWVWFSAGRNIFRLSPKKPDGAQQTSKEQ